jgi:hypothetical protein
VTTRHETTRRGPARHEAPAVDAAALHAARLADRLVAAARERGSARWVTFLEPIPDRLRDDEIRALRATALRARAAPQARIRSTLPADRPFARRSIGFSN